MRENLLPGMKTMDTIFLLEEKMEEAGVGHVASVVGRFYAMDRDLRWERVESADKMMTRGTERTAETADAAIQSYYDNPTDANRCFKSLTELRKPRSFSQSSMDENTSFSGRWNSIALRGFTSLCNQQRRGQLAPSSARLERVVSARQASDNPDESRAPTH